MKRITPRNAYYLNYPAINCKDEISRQLIKCDKMVLTNTCFLASAWIFYYIVLWINSNPLNTPIFII